MKKAILEIKNLTVEYIIEKETLSAVDDVSFCVLDGETLALVGESGCGKSSIANAVTKLLLHGNERVSGEIIIDGHDVLKLSQKQLEELRGDKVGMIFQNPLNSLNPVYNIGFQVAEPFLAKRIKRKDIYPKVLDSFIQVHIPDAENRMRSYPHELSGGQQQRIMISMSAVRHPMLLIADEPTTALDVTIESQILELIKSLKYGEKPDVYDKPSSTLLITHNFGAVAEIADHIAVMYAGNIIEIGNVFSVFESPLHPYTKLLMQSLPGIRKTEGRLASIPGTVPKFMGKTYKGCRFASRCPVAEESCFVLKPELVEISKGHSCACFKVGEQL